VSARQRARISVRVQPRASRSEVAGMHGGAIRIRLTAPPIDNAANDALVKFLAERLKVPRHQLRVIAGLSSRSKIVEIDGGDAQAIMAALLAD
jgi:uncharacterized protein (TIGR00251 family)